MKLKVLVVSALISTGAFAQWFPAQVQVLSLPLQVSAEVFNHFYEPIICNGQVFGKTAFGQFYSTYFSEQIMFAGSNRFAYVVSTPSNPFVSGWTNIHCRFARRW